MAFSFIASTGIGATGSGTELDMGSTMNIAAGDSLVCIAAWEGGTSTIDVDSTIPDNPFTMLAEVTINSVYMRMGYLLNAAANASTTWRLTLGTARTYRALVVMQFRPSGGTVSLAASDPGATATGSDYAQSNNISPAGIDLAIVGGLKQYNSGAFADPLIADLAATNSQTESGSNYAGLWYKLFTSSQSNIHAEIDCQNGTDWCCGIIALGVAATEWTAHRHKTMVF